MPTAKELNVQVEDRPGALGKLCRALADRRVNILAFQASSFEPRTQVRLVVDDLATAEIVLDAAGMVYTEEEVAQVTLPHRPGELAHVASRLGEANININYAYAGLEPATNGSIIFLGVTQVERAARILDQAAASAVSI
jgi:hypothetical protein